MEKAIIDALIVGGPALVTGWIGFYVGSYLKKKGENQAIHEDIGKLIDQVRAVTQTTKEIEAKISDEMWGRQRRWDLKREVLFEAARALARVDDALVGLHSVTKLEKNQNDINWVRSRNNSLTEWSKTYSAFQESIVLVTTVCNKELVVAFQGYAAMISKVAERIATDIDGQIFPSSQNDRLKMELVLRASIRKELGIEEATALAAAK